MENEKIIVGNGKKRKDNWLTVTVNFDKLSEHVHEFKGKKYVNLNINIYDSPNEYGKDVMVSINQYQYNQ